MIIPSGFCTASNDVKPRTHAQLINEYSENDFNRIFKSDFAKGKLPSILNENINRSIRNNQTVLLDSAGSGFKEPLNELALWLSYKWPIGKEISVKLLTGDIRIRDFISSTIREWEKYANIKFKFVDSGNAEIRISLSNDLNSWSKIGTACLTVSDQRFSTMNLGCFYSSLSSQEIRATILHEFGHSLGCIHEHQSPSSNIPWDKQAILRALSIIPGWDEQKIQINILDKFPSSDISNSEYDEDSIMHYYLPNYFTADGRGFKMNLELSQQDKDFISCCYPF